MSDFDPTRELHLCWQDTIEEVSLEDEEYFSSAESIKIKSVMNREKAGSSRKSTHAETIVKAKNGSKNTVTSSSHSSKLIIPPKSNFTKISKSCKSRGNKPSETSNSAVKVRTAYNAYSTTSRLSGHSGSGKNLRKTTTTSGSI